MKTAVMGAGAVGSYFGARLSRVGAPVWFVGRGEHRAAVAERGLRVLSVEGDFTVHPPVAEDPNEVGPCDLVLFCVKSTDTDEAASAMAPMVCASTIIVSLQNGIENEEILEELYPGQVLPGLCYVGARIDEPGTVVHSAAGRVVLGERSGLESERLRAVCRLFERAGVPVKGSSDILADLWKKLLWNLGFNTLSALTRATVGQMLAHPTGRDVLLAAMGEAVRVARAAGVRLEDDLPARILESSGGFGELTTSMLQDVEKGRPLEVDALNGTVVRLGERFGVPTPCNRILLGCALVLSAVNANR